MRGATTEQMRDMAARRAFAEGTSVTACLQSLHPTKHRMKPFTLWTHRQLTGLVSQPLGKAFAAVDGSERIILDSTGCIAGHFGAGHCTIYFSKYETYLPS